MYRHQQLPRLLFLLVAVCSFHFCFGQAAPGPDDFKRLVRESIKSLTGNEPTTIGDFTIRDKGNGERQISGPISVFGKGNVQIESNLRSNLKPSFFKFEFPQDAILNLNLLSQLTGGNLSGFMPDGFSGDAGIAIRKLEVDIDTSGYTPSRISLAFEGSRPFGLLGDGLLRLDKTEFEFGIESPKSPSRKVTGKLGGSLLAGNSRIGLSSQLSNRKEEIRFSGLVENLSLSGLLNAAGGTAILNSLPAFMANLSLRTLNFEISPFNKTFSVKANSNAGDIELRMSPGKQGGAMQLLMALAPPSGFRFSSIDPSLQLLDGINLSGTALVISNYNGTVESSLSVVSANVRNGFPLVSGLNIFSHIRLSDELGRFLGRPDLDLYGSLDKSMNLAMSAAINFDNLKLAEGISFKEVKFGLRFKPAAAKINFNLSGRMEALIKNDLLSFNAGFDFAPTDVQLSAFFLMEAIKKANAQTEYAKRDANNIPEPPEWNEPFGVKGVGLRKMGFSLGVSPKSPVFLSSMGISADVRLGVNPDFNKNIRGAFTANLDIANPLNSMLDIKLQNLTVVGMIDAFRPQANLSGTLRKWLDWGLENAYLRIVPETKTYLPENKVYERGILAGGTLKLGGLSANAELAVSDNAFGFKASVDPMVVETGGFTWFALRGFEQGNKAQANLQLNGNNPELLIDGSVTVLGISSRTSIRVNNSGARFKVQGDAANGAFNASLEVEAQQLNTAGGFRVKAEFNNRLQSEVARLLIDFIKRESAKSQAAYSNAQNSLQQAKNAAGSDAEKGLIDVANGFVSAFKEIDKGMAVAGQYVVKGLIGEAINIRRIYFETNLNRNQFSVAANIDMTIAGKQITESATIDLNVSSATALAEKIVGQIGNSVIGAFSGAGSEIEKGWNSFVQGADQFFSQAGKGFEQLGKEFEKAGIAAVNWIQQAGKAIYNWGDETFNGKKVEGPNAGTPPSMIPYNITKYTLTITGIRVDKVPSTNLGITTHYPDGKELEIFGSITIIPGGKVWTNAGSNMYGMNRRQGDYYSIGLGSIHTLNTPKYFYCCDQDVPASSLTVYTHLFDSDDENIFTAAFVSNEEMRNTSRVTLNSVAPGGSTSGAIAAWNREGDHAVTVFYTLSAAPKISDQEMINAVNSRNSGNVDATIRRGGNPFVPGLLQAAIRNNDAGTISVLGKYGVAVSPADMNLAVSSAPGAIEALVGIGGIVTRNELVKAVDTRNPNLVDIVMRKGVQPDAEIVRKAIQTGDRNITQLLLRKKILLGTPELDLAIGRNDAELVSLVMNYGALPGQQQLTATIRNKQEALTRLLVTRITPGQEALQEAANQNNTGIFLLLAENGGTLQNDQPLFRAIDNNNRDLLLYGLRIGGNPTEALKYSIQKNNTTLLMLCLENRGDPAAAIGYAVRSNNMNLVTALLKDYRVNPNDCVNEAILNNNVPAAQLALGTGQVATNRYITAAAEKNNTALVKLMVDARADPNLALPASVRLNNTELAAFLISRGADARSMMLLPQAINNNSAEMVNLLLRSGADPNTGMNAAIEKRNTAIVRLLLDNGASPQGFIVKPAGQGLTDMVKLLLDKGAVPDEGIAAAVTGNHTAIVKMLLLAGANSQGLIQVPVKNNSPEMVEDLLKAGAAPQPGMRGAVDANLTPVVKLLLDYGASGAGYLQKPAAAGNVEMVRMLLDKNASPQEGIEASIRANQTAVVRLLIERGANGNALIAVPAGFGNMEIIELLLSKGADPEMGIKAAVLQLKTRVSERLIQAGADGSKREYMDFLVQKNFAELVPVLVKAGNKVDSTVVDSKGQTYLHRAAELDNSYALVKALLDAGSSVFARDNDGNTPLHMAVDEGKDDIETVRILLEAGSDPCAQNNKKRNIFKQAKGAKVKKLIKEFGGSRKCSED